MELDDMKNIWQQHDKALQQNNMLNEQLINHLLKDKSKNILNRFINMEYLGAGICGAMLLFLLANPGSANGSLMITICYIISVTFMLAALSLSLYKIKQLNKIDLNTNAVTDIAEKIQRFKLVITVERSVVIIAAPVLIAALFAVLMLWLHDVDVFEDIASYLPRLICGFVLGIAAMIILYRAFYFQNIKQVMDNLKEIEKFKQDN